MASIATNVQWGSKPSMYFDFSYEKKRDGATQYYAITVSCRPLTGSSYFGYPIYIQISLDGAQKTSYTLKNASPSRWSSAITNTTGWLAVSNKTSGTTALSIRAYSSTDTSYGEKTFSYTLEIDPAASKISCTTANIESNPTISISRASSDFTHSISYVFVNLKGDIKTKTSDTSITDWTIPADFYAQIPNAKTGAGTLTCTTYSGDTVIGTDTCTLSVTTDEAKCKPTVTGSVVDTNDATKALTGDENNILVRYQSKAHCEIATTLNKNAGSILAKTINNTAVSGNSLTFENVETGVFDFWAKDSREYPGSDKVVKTLIPYIKLTANVTAWRVDPTSGNAMLKVEGNCFKGNFGAADNTLTIKYRHGNNDYEEVKPTILDNNTYTITIPLSGLDYTQVFNYEVIVFDKLSTVPKSATIQKGIPVFDWGENDFNFNVPVTINGVNILEKLAELEALVAKG